MKALKIMSLILIGMIALGSTATAIEVEGYRAPGTHDPDALQSQQESLSEWLVSEQINKALETPISVTITAQEMAELESVAGSNEQKLLVGVTKTTDALIDLEELQYGTQRVGDNGRIWTGSVHSKGASALRIEFADVDLPDGAELYIYNNKGEAFGPYTGKGYLGTGEFWSHTITGDTLLLQLRTLSKDATYFTIREVGHYGSKFLYTEFSQRDNAKSFCNVNASCVENAECGTDNAVNTAKDAIAHYTFIQRPYQYMCSGGLIADEAQSGTPYFLTANHCVSRAKVADTVETYFFYSRPCGTCSGPTTTHTLGASIAETNATGDYTLLQLNEPAPAGSAFMGFTTDEVAFTHNYNLYRISHPSGAPQAYSEHKVDTATGTCQSWPRGSWIYSADVYGATEGGSSGSPVLNSNGLVVGQLSGACGYNLSDVCDSASNATVDGALASYYPEVAGFLGGGGSGCSDDLDGDGYIAASCGGDDCNDGVFAINPGATEICGDLIDNNCNGTIDEDCGAPTCDAKGVACTVANADACCSGRCHARKLTCG